MENKKTAVFGLCADPLAAENVVAALVKAGFSNNSISVLLADNQSTKDFAHEKHTKAPEGTTTGVATGVATVGDGDGTLGDGGGTLGDAGNALVEGEGELADGTQEVTRSAHKAEINTNVWR